MSSILTATTRPSDQARPVARSFRYTPGIIAIQKLVEKYSFYEVEERAAKGELTAIWGGTTWEAPLLSACGVTPVAISELWREESKDAEAVGEQDLQIPPEFCSMIKAMAGRLRLRSAKTIRKIIYFGGTCEPISTAYELAIREGYDVHCIEGVHAFRKEEKRDEIVKFLAGELQKVAIWLTGKEVDEARLLEEIKKRNLILRKVRRILELRVQNPLYLSAVPTLQILNGSSHCFGDPDGYLAALDIVIAELEEAAKAKIVEPYIPLVLAGGAAGGMGMLNVIEESRGAIVGWLIVGTGDYREDVPPLESVAHYVLDAQAKGELGEGAGTSATFRKDRLEELVRETGAKGIISSAITGCPYGSVVQQLEREHFKKIGVPTIALEGTVHRGRPTEEQVMRVRTFVEMIG